MANPIAKAARRLKRWYSRRPDLGALHLLAEEREWRLLEKRGRRILKRVPDHDEVLVLVAFSLQQQNRLEEALKFAVRALAGPVAKAHPYFIAGFALKGMGRLVEACGYLRTAAALEPGDQAKLRYLIEAVAASDGVNAAAAEFAAHCRRTGQPGDFAVASIRSVRDWVRETGHTLLEAGEVEEIPFQAPVIWGAPEPYERHVAVSNKPYVADLANARIFSHSSLVVMPDGTVLSDTGGHPQFGRYVSFRYESLVLGQADRELLLDFGGYETREIDAGIHLAGSASEFFGHWLPEFLPRLEFLRCHPDFSRLPIIVDADMPQSHFDHLRRHADNPLIQLRAGQSLVCRRLLVSPAPAFSPVEMLPHEIPVHEMPGLSPRALRFLRGSFDGTSSVPQTGRFFLARRKMKWRRLLNEPEITAELSRSGFETVFLEELDAGQQIELFRRAEWIVAPNGSALLNLIFSDPAVKLLILSQPGLFNWGTFQGPMRSLGYHPVWLCGEEVGAGNYKHADYIVPIKPFRRALAGMGLG